MSSAAANIKIEPVNVTWEIEASEEIDFDGVSASDFGGTAFTIYSAKDAVQYYVWGDENSTDVDPVDPGTGIEVDYGASASSTAIATACAAAIDLVSGFTATSSGTVVTVNRTAVGAVTSTVDIDSGVAITMCRQGKDFDLGLLQGDVELSAAPSVFTVTAQQSGLTPRAQLLQGFESVSVSLTMLETITSNLEAIYAQYGDTWTPSAGTEVTSLGTARQGNNLLVDAARLVLKPVNASTDLDNVSLMLAVPVPESLVFSGENPKTLSVVFNGVVDDQLDTRASVLVIGDQTQAGLRS